MLKSVLTVVFFLILFGLSHAIAGVTIYLGWEWLLVPLGVPAVTIWHAWGLRILFEAMSNTAFMLQKVNDIHSKVCDLEKSPTELMSRLAAIWVTHGICIVLMWVAAYFMY